MLTAVALLHLHPPDVHWSNCFSTAGAAEVTPEQCIETVMHQAHSSNAQLPRAQRLVSSRSTGALHLKTTQFARSFRLPAALRRSAAATVAALQHNGEAVVLVDHGSKRAEANAMLEQFADVYRCVVVYNAACLESAVAVSGTNCHRWCGAGHHPTGSLSEQHTWSWPRHRWLTPLQSVPGWAYPE